VHLYHTENKMNTNKLVSVIIPTFNRSLDLTRALKTIQNQSFKDFEVKVIDDNKDVEEIELVKTICKQFGVSYLRNIRTPGGCGARNTGILSSSAKYVAFLDDDDLWFPDKLKVQINFLEKNTDFTGVYCGYSAYYSDHDFHLISNSGININHKDVLQRKCPSSTSLVTVNRNALCDAGLFDEKLPSFQDYDMWLKLTNIGPIGYQNDVLAVFTQHGGDRVSVNLSKRFKGLRLIIEKWGHEIAQYQSIATFEKSFKSDAYIANALAVAGNSYIYYIKYRGLSFFNSNFTIKGLLKLLSSFLGGKIYWFFVKQKAKKKLEQNPNVKETIRALR